jgi:predicted RNase H-like HicB family nuclease
MELRAVVHRAGEGGFWAEVPDIPGCITEGDTWDELTQNLREAVAGCLDVPQDSVQVGETAERLLQIAM